MKWKIGGKKKKHRSKEDEGESDSDGTSEIGSSSRGASGSRVPLTPKSKSSSSKSVSAKTFSEPSLALAPQSPVFGATVEKQSSSPPTIPHLQQREEDRVEVQTSSPRDLSTARSALTRHDSSNTLIDDGDSSQKKTKKKGGGLKFKGFKGLNKKKDKGEDTTDTMSRKGSHLPMLEPSTPDASLNEEIIRLERQIDNLTQERDGLMAIVEAKDMTLKQLEDELKNTAAGMSTPSTAVGDNERIQKLQNDIDDLHREIVSLKTEKNKLSAEMVTLQNENRRMLDLESQMHERDAHIHKLTTERDTQLHQVESLEKEKNALEKEVKLLRETPEAGNLSDVEKALGEHVESYRQLLREEQNRTSELSQKLSEQHRELMELRHKETAFAAKTERYETGESRLQAEVVSLREEKGKVESEVRSLHNNLETVSSELHTANLRCETLQRENSSMKTQISILEKTRAEASSHAATDLELTELKRTSALQANQLETNSSELAKLREDLYKANGELTEAKMAKTMAVDELRASGIRSTSLQQQLEAALKEVERANSTKTSRVGDLSSQVSSLQQQIAEAEGRNQTLQAQVASLRSQVAESEKATHQLKESLKQQEVAKTAAGDTHTAAMKDLEERNRQLLQTVQRQEERLADSSFLTTGMTTPTAAPPPKKTATVNGLVLSNAVVKSEDVPIKWTLSVVDVTSKPRGQTGGVAEVICVLKSRFVSALFDTTEIRSEEEMGGIKKVLGPLFDSLHWRDAKNARAPIGIARVLLRMRKLWDLAEDLRLGLVQVDPSLSTAFQETRTTAVDWQTTLENLRGSAEVLEDRNRELEAKCQTASLAAEEARSISQMDRERLKAATLALKKHVRRAEKSGMAVDEERNALVTEVQRLRRALKGTLEENRRLQGAANYRSKEMRELQSNVKGINFKLEKESSYLDVFKRPSLPTHKPTEYSTRLKRKHSSSTDHSSSSSSSEIVRVASPRKPIPPTYYPTTTAADVTSVRRIPLNDTDDVYRYSTTVIPPTQSVGKTVIAEPPHHTRPIPTYTTQAPPTRTSFPSVVTSPSPVPLARAGRPVTTATTSPFSVALEKQRAPTSKRTTKTTPRRRSPSPLGGLRRFITKGK